MDYEYLLLATTNTNSEEDHPTVFTATLKARTERTHKIRIVEIWSYWTQSVAYSESCE